MDENRILNPDLIDKVVEEAIRVAVGFKPLGINQYLPRSLREIISLVVNSVAEDIRGRKQDMLFCGICGRGPFTPMGLYLHLKRTHKDKIARMVEEELEEKIWNYTYSL